MKLASSLLRSPALSDQLLGFSVWAKTAPKDYLASYPEAAKAIAKSSSLASVGLIALVDDVLPRIMEKRTSEEQGEISKLYIAHLPKLGFDQVHLVSTFVSEDNPWDYFRFSTRFTGMQFAKLLPESKGMQEGLNLSEVVGFLWHLYVLDNAMAKFKLTGFLAGIRSEYFYLAARQVLESHDVYFLQTT